MELAAAVDFPKREALLMISGLEFYTRLIYEERLRDAERERAIRRALRLRNRRDNDKRSL